MIGSLDISPTPPGPKSYRFRLLPPSYDDHRWDLEVRRMFGWERITSLHVHPANTLSPSPGKGFGWSIEQITAWAHEEAAKWANAQHAPTYNFELTRADLRWRD